MPVAGMKEPIIEPSAAEGIYVKGAPAAAATPKGKYLPATVAEEAKKPATRKQK